MFTSTDEINKINEELNKMQGIWYEQVAKGVYNKNADKKDLSLPFYSGVSPKAAGKKIIMIVGQEARDYKRYFDEDQAKWRTPRQSSQWSRDFVDVQLGYAVDGMEYDKNGSPFWCFVRSFGGGNMYPVWTNLDKAHRYISGKTVPLTVELELAFNTAFEYKGETKSVLLHEIEIIKPDAIIFVTGPDYYKSMACALNCGNLEKSEFKPYYSEENSDYKNIIQDLTKQNDDKAIPVFWTYHPHPLKRNHLLDYMQNELHCKLKNYLI